ncbi:MAG: hypothetical protein M1816_003634 [Peltula sp. TS41687]|nr:MAG: hypothetical protein M1816_003634 [Peltula sp. TS41687]
MEDCEVECGLVRKEETLTVVVHHACASCLLTRFEQRARRQLQDVYWPWHDAVKELQRDQHSTDAAERMRQAKVELDLVANEVARQRTFLWSSFKRRHQWWTDDVLDLDVITAGTAAGNAAE